MIGSENYTYHRDKWWWGETLVLVARDGLSTVEIQYDDNYPSIAFIKGLSVYQSVRQKGIGTELLKLCEEIAKDEGYKFTQLTANKEQDWLVEWYKSSGYQIIMKDKHEFTMLKALDSPRKQWKPSEEQMDALAKAVEESLGKDYHNQLCLLEYYIKNKIL